MNRAGAIDLKRRRGRGVRLRRRARGACLVGEPSSCGCARGRRSSMLGGAPLAVRPRGGDRRPSRVCRQGAFRQAGDRGGPGGGGRAGHGSGEDSPGGWPDASGRRVGLREAPRGALQHGLEGWGAGGGRSPARWPGTRTGRTRVGCWWRSPASALRRRAGGRGSGSSGRRSRTAPTAPTQRWVPARGARSVIGDESAAARQALQIAREGSVVARGGEVIPSTRTRSASMATAGRGRPCARDPPRVRGGGDRGAPGWPLRSGWAGAAETRRFFGGFGGTIS